MKINRAVLSIPPYISTSWNNISALSTRDKKLVVSLIDGGSIEVPDLSEELINQTFQLHTAFLEHEDKISRSFDSPPSPLSLLQSLANNASSFQIGFTSPDGMNSLMEHNPDQADHPDLPKELLEKLQEITKLVTHGNNAVLPKPEPHCNCIHCQIARAINGGALLQENIDTEEVSEEELTFTEWEIVQTGEKMFTVTSRLDINEKYNVFLGHPVGCTCGKEGCEHILAVLKS